MRLSTLKSICILLFMFFSLNGQATEVKRFHYTGQKELSLEGEWTFYWKQLLVSGDSAMESEGFPVAFPNYWNNHKHQGYTPKSYGYASYRTIITSKKNRDVAIEYTGPHCAQRIYMNGELIVETGKVGTNRESYRPLWLPGTVKTSLKEGENELIIQISNFDHDKGGVYRAPIIGNPEHLLAKRKYGLLLDSFIAGGLSVMGLLFLGFSIFWRNSRSFIYFGLTAILFSIWYVNFGGHAFKVYFPRINWNVAMHLTYISFYGFALFFSLFVYETYKVSYGRLYYKIILCSYTLLTLTVIIGSPRFFTSMIVLGYAVIFGQFSYTIVILVMGFRKKVKESILGFLVILALSFSVLLTIAWIFNFVPWIPETLGLVFVLTFLLSGIFMVRKVGGDYKSVVQLEKEANIQNEKIQEQATKLRLMDEMKNRFFANVSHDLRSPLTLIKGGLYKLKQVKEPLSAEEEIHYNSIGRNVNQLIHFTDEIRDLNLLDKKEIEVLYSLIDVNSLLKVSFDMFQSYAETRKIELFFKPENETVEIHGDENRIRRVINNLLSNAFKFTSDEGRIELSLEKVKLGVLIKLLDTGKGISDEDQPYVFDRFYQGSRNDYRKDEGMGIGLALVKEIVSIHGGTVNLESKVDEGSVFSVFLPFNYDRALTHFKKEVIPSKLPEESNDQAKLPIDFKAHEKTFNHTILLVDDHTEVRDYIASVINENYYVIEAKNGVEALEILKSQKIDLVITDLMMPWMDGFELIDKMNADKELSRVKIMVVSARTTQEDKLKILDKGVNEFISKPFEHEEFNKRVSNILEISETTILQDLAEKKGKYSDIERNVLFKINNLIMEQIDNSKLTTSVLADELATSERNANRIIKKLTGLPPKTYIQKVRMDYVEILLKEGKVNSLTEASQSIGMSNATQFAKQFEKVKGYHPSK